MRAETCVIIIILQSSLNPLKAGRTIHMKKGKECLCYKMFPYIVTFQNKL